MRHLFPIRIALPRNGDSMMQSSSGLNRKPSDALATHRETLAVRESLPVAAERLCKNGELCKNKFAARRNSSLIGSRFLEISQPHARNSQPTMTPRATCASVFPRFASRRRRPRRPGHVKAHYSRSSSRHVGRLARRCFDNVAIFRISAQACTTNEYGVLPLLLLILPYSSPSPRMQRLSCDRRVAICEHRGQDVFENTPEPKSI